MTDRPDVESVVEQLKIRAYCVHIAVEAEVADDIKAHLLEAAALLTEQAAQIAEAGRLLKELAGALHYELDARYGVLDSNPHPGELLRYERDMEVVERARAWLTLPEKGE